jgi:cyclophilin family peptidyl-prolyl cis-trans isomerase
MIRYLISLSVVVAVVGCGKPAPSGSQDAAAKPAQPPRKASVPTPAAEEVSAPPQTPTNPTNDPALAACDTFIAEQKIDRTKSGWKSNLPEPPKLPFDAAKSYFWIIETNVGTIKIKLMPKIAPMHVSSTIYLSRLGFYDGVVFHRVIPGFMAQGGDPTGRGSGGPGYQYGGELDKSVRHDKRGILSMAHRGPGTDGSQFFLTFGPTPHLNNVHTIFGEVVDGMDALNKLEERGSEGGATSERLVMKKTTIEVE